MTLPGFIGIGAHKAGTTWLYLMLAQNPSIWLPPFKEVHFFDRLNPTPEKQRRRALQLEQSADRLEKSKRTKGSAGSNAEKAAFLRSLAGDDILSDQWYHSIFAHPAAAGRISGEITPSYLDATKALPKISEMLPTTKFVLIVREPLSRSLSQMRMAISNQSTTPETKEEWALYIARLKKITRGTYNIAIPLWRSYFDADRLLILPFGGLKQDPAGLLREIEDFIGAERFENYKAMRKRVYKTKDIEIPEWVCNEVEEMVSIQKAYLIDAFGQDFYEATK